jgi:predicted MPP superfamily phosphohydrolase
MPKGDAKLNELNVVFAADLHLSTIDGERLLKRIVEKINSVNPDLILFAGDVVDDKASILRNRGIGESFKLLKPRLGIYTINGNHEFINNVEPSVKFLEEYGMKVLRDNYELVDSSVYIVGREDVVMRQFTGKGRKSLEQIVEPIENIYPKILLDHTPTKLEQAVNNGIDLQLSGHTHHGQIWPANIITGLIYELSWGYKKKGNTQFYVTSGAGTWGPPVRTGSKSEIVNIKIKFSD